MNLNAEWCTHIEITSFYTTLLFSEILIWPTYRHVSIPKFAESGGDTLYHSGQHRMAFLSNVNIR